jgi:hypothetical protein
MIRYFLAQEIKLKAEYVSPVVESYDVGLLINVAKEVFRKARKPDNGAAIEKMLSQFHQSNEHRKRVAHGLWVPFKEGGTVHYVPRNKLTSKRFTEQAKELEKEADRLLELRSKLEEAFFGGY